MENVIKFFQKLQKATGATINLDKTTILPINTDQTSYIQRYIPNISVKEQHQEIKILGITICESVKEAILTNWHEIVQKMQNHVNKLSLRQLSLFGKATILNSLILAKTTFLSNVFPIPDNKITEIHKNIFNYLWQNKKQEPISRKTLFLQKEKGGSKYKRT